MTESYGPPMQAKSKSPARWIVLGCSLVVVGIAGFIAFIFFVVFTAMRQNIPYQEAMRRAENDPRVAAVLGRPVKSGWFISGSIKTTGSSGFAHLEIPLSGSRTEATYYVKAERRRGRWHFTELIVAAQGHDDIDLLSAPPRESPDTSPPDE